MPCIKRWGCTLLLLSMAAPHFAHAIADDFTFSMVDLETDSTAKFINQKLNKKLLKHPIFEVSQTTDIIVEAAEEMNIDPLMLLALIENESSYNPDAVGGAGEIGLMQVRPKTAKWIMKKAKKSYKGKATLFRPSQNIRVGMTYLKYLHAQFESPQATIAAFNMGPRNVRRYMKRKVIPSAYYRRVVKRYRALKAEYAMSTLPELTPDPPFVVAAN